MNIMPKAIGLELDTMERELRDYWFAIECGWDEDMNQYTNITHEKLITNAYNKLCSIWERIYNRGEITE